MAKANLGGMEIEIDEDGFIQEPNKWNKDVAEDLAKTENASPMSEEHWKVVNYLRDYYVKFGIAPPIPLSQPGDEALRFPAYAPRQPRGQGRPPARGHECPRPGQPGSGISDLCSLGSGRGERESPSQD
jgi:hypothetical protein